MMPSLVTRTVLLPPRPVTIYSPGLTCLIAGGAAGAPPPPGPPPRRPSPWGAPAAGAAGCCADVPTTAATTAAAKNVPNALLRIGPPAMLDLGIVSFCRQ